MIAMFWPLEFLSRFLSTNRYIACVDDWKIPIDTLWLKHSLVVTDGLRYFSSSILVSDVCSVSTKLVQKQSAMYLSCLPLFPGRVLKIVLRSVAQNYSLTIVSRWELARRLEFPSSCYRLTYPQLEYSKMSTLEEKRKWLILFIKQWQNDWLNPITDHIDTKQVITVNNHYQTLNYNWEYNTRNKTVLIYKEKMSQICKQTDTCHDR